MSLQHPPEPPGSPDAPAVVIQDLVVRYGSVTAVDGLSLVAPRGAITAVLGPNGAGKTTTVETAEGYRRPAAGTVSVLGYHPARDRADLRQRVGVMLQEGGAYAGARVAEVLRAAAALYADPLPSGELLALLGLTDQSRRSVKRLSGGQAQRLRLALAVVGRPELAFLDEPTAGLDPQARHATWDLVRDLRDAGGSVVLTTHYLEEAEQLADHVVIVDAGRAVASGSPRELIGAGSNPQTVRFEAAPGLDLVDLARVLPAGSLAAGSPEGHYEVTGEVGPQTLAAVAQWCATHDVRPQRLELSARTLEDVFLDLTGRDLRE